MGVAVVHANVRRDRAALPIHSREPLGQPYSRATKPDPPRRDPARGRRADETARSGDQGERRHGAAASARAAASSACERGDRHEAALEPSLSSAEAARSLKSAARANVANSER